MIRVKGQEEYTVLCKRCKKTLAFDSPKDLLKPGHDVYAIICPLCNEVVCFSSLDVVMDPNFSGKLKEANMIQQKNFNKEILEEYFKKKSQEFKANIQSMPRDDDLF